MPLSTVIASLGPMPEMVSSFSKSRFSFGSAKPEQGDLVLAHVGVDVQARLGALGRERGKRRDGDGGVVADAAAIDDGPVGRLHQQPAAQESNHPE